MIGLTLKDELKTKVMIAKTGNSLRSFSKNIGVSHCYLSQIISKKRMPSPKIAYKLASGLGVKIEDIFLVETVDDSKHENKLSVIKM